MRVVNTVYILRNHINNKVYIGQTWYSLKKRFGQGYNQYLMNDIQKYGKEQFYYEIIAQCFDQDMADKVEVYYIILFDSTNRNNGYNIMRGGSNSRHSPETIEKMSLLARERCNTVKGREHIDMLSKMNAGKPAPNKGIPMPESQKAKMRGIPKTQEHRDKISKSHLGKKQSEEFKKNASLKNAKISDNVIIQIKELYSTGNYTQKYLAIKFNINDGTVCRVINGKRRKWTQ